MAFKGKNPLDKTRGNSLDETRGKQENLSILEEIYHDPKTKIQPKKPVKKSVQEYFQNPQKVNHLLAGSILIFGLAAIVLGFFQFKNNIASPFWPKDPQNTNQIDKEDLLGLRQKDTDQDGLSDYDELYIYGSSPYLKDTDSDGVNDEEEVIFGTDPSCPEGENCFAIWSDDTGNSSVDPSEVPPGLFSGTRVDQLRQVLQQAGMSASDLASFTDEELIATYEEILNQSQTDIPAPTQSVTLPVSQIEDLTPDQLRQLLLEAGVTKEVLDNVTDKELMDLVEETLSTY